MGKEIDAEVIRGLLKSSIQLNAQMVVASALILMLIARLDEPAKREVRQAIRGYAEHLLSQTDEHPHGFEESALLSTEINRYLAAAGG